ncbi:hypothetical protein [Actinoplanes derwentensis]|uniref:Lipoprotein n=1 Tax=Actinoplanes derwentensis TaxID=113562 RepID=A0A1H1TP92_9ACTN|nr:hypothetical protein [Actinoplanes derwentensis]GID85087.1 hypothetical protein Ade03nite_40110 [Actinoplanes derwentensis]SDS61871.1 hypothetical protein SAMN04489716_1194 [Actinoplanes derwentensis]
MADIRRRLRAACAAVLVAALTAACDTTAQFAPSLPVEAGFRVDAGVLKVWTGTPCPGVLAVTLIFDVGTSGSAKQVWTVPKPGVLLERMDLLTTAGESFPDPYSYPEGVLQVEEPMPTDYDWTKAESLNFAVDGPPSFGARIDVPRMLRESPEHPPESYFFGRSGWLTAADVQRENLKSFLTICTPDPK